MKRYAIFFPQFYTIDINDLTWGNGFTDWALVATANAFDYWPRRSPTCGFYDLSKEDDISARFEAASDGGLDGFAIYHYRFDDGPELHSVERYLLQKNPPEGFNYFYIWANEDWSTRWVGGKVRILKKLSASPDQSAVTRHVNYLTPYMASTFYTRVGERPLFVIYRPDHFLDTAAVLTLYRSEFRRVGLDPLIGYFGKNIADRQYSKLFDFCYLFEPRLFFNFQGVRKNPVATWIYRVIAKMFSSRVREASAEFVTSILNRHSSNYSFPDFLRYFSSDARRGFIDTLQCPVQEIITSGWNNAPRYRDRFTRLDVPSVEQFSSMMDVLANSLAANSEFPLLCNAWNEWSEGAAIEPCCYMGDALLTSYLDRKGA